jgi:hypothetical protein
MLLLQSGDPHACAELGGLHEQKQKESKQHLRYCILQNPTVCEKVYWKCDGCGNHASKKAQNSRRLTWRHQFRSCMLFMLNFFATARVHSQKAHFKEGAGARLDQVHMSMRACPKITYFGSTAMYFAQDLLHICAWA